MYVYILLDREAGGARLLLKMQKLDNEFKKKKNN